MANFWNGIIRHIRKNLYIQTTSKKQKPDFMHHKKEWVQLPYEGALYQSLGANTRAEDLRRRSSALFFERAKENPDYFKEIVKEFK